MRKLIIVAVVVFGLLTGIANARGGGGGHHSGGHHTGDVSVHGYFTHNGTYVSPHHRTAPDGTLLNNWSTRGNVNPYTGRPGTKNPYPGSSLGYSSGSVGLVLPGGLRPDIVIENPVNKPDYLTSIGARFSVVGFEKDIDVRQSTLRFLYGNYVPEVQGSLWDIQTTLIKGYQVPEKIMKDVKELDDGNPHIVTVAFHTFFKEQGETKLLVITQAVKSGVDCHACGVLVGFSIFKYRRTTNVSYFDLEYLNPYMGFSGQWGKISPSITLMKHRTLDHFAIRFRDCYMNQGYSSCSEWTTDLRSSEFTHSNLKGFEGPKPEVSGDSPEFKKWTTFQTEFLAGK